MNASIEYSVPSLYSSKIGSPPIVYLRDSAIAAISSSSLYTFITPLEPLLSAGLTTSGNFVPSVSGLDFILNL